LNVLELDILALDISDKDKLKKFRVWHGLTQREMVAKLSPHIEKITSPTRPLAVSTYNQWEVGRKEPKPYVMIALRELDQELRITTPNKNIL
jgi:hypothetical protein